MGFTRGRYDIIWMIVLFERFGHILKEALIVSDGVANTGFLLLARKTII